MQVGKSGICVCATPQEISAILHDLQHTEASAAMLTFERIEGAILAPIRWGANGSLSVRNVWLTQLGTGAGGEVQYRGASPQRQGGEPGEEWEEELSTEVVVLKIHQDWVGANSPR